MYYVLVQPYSHTFAYKLKDFSSGSLFQPYLWNMNGVRLPMEDWCIIIYVSNLDVYCVFHHLRGETPS